MTENEIRQRLDSNLQRHGWEAAEVRLRPDPFGGWRLLLISNNFQGVDAGNRRRIAMDGLPDDEFQLIDVLTPEEADSGEGSFFDVDPETLPLWPEALSRGSEEPSVHFASDLDDELDAPVVSTFYSLRGGVGRSTALAYTARTLASRGRTVICVDLDLEAPGLPELLGHSTPERGGVVDLLIQFDQGLKPDVADHLLRISDADELYCLPAGKPNADYARKLRLVDPVAWYQEAENPLADLIDALGSGLSFQPDAILLDARTGVSPLSAPLLFDLADLAIIGFYPHPQGRVGTGNLVKALLNAKSRRTFDGIRMTPEPRFLVSPVPAARREERQRYEDRAIDWIGDWFAAAGLAEGVGAHALDPAEVTSVISYDELVAVSDATSTEAATWRPYQDLADWIDQLIPSDATLPLEAGSTPDKPAILEDLSFSAGTAEDQEHFLETFVSTDRVTRALEESVPLVIGRKGTGKTALFRWISEVDHHQTVVVMAPAALRPQYPTVLGAAGLKAVEHRLELAQESWVIGWAAISAIAVWHKLGSPDPPPGIAESVSPLYGPIDELTLVNVIGSLVGQQDAGLAIDAWLTELDGISDAETWLLFDGLDTGFGNSSDERQRRQRALEGLFSFLLDRSPHFGSLRFKVLLREDIWRNLRFENKSHLFGRSIRLEWTEQAEYLKTVLKQALLSDRFKALARSAGLLSPEVSEWSEDEVFRGWNLLVGERMKGGKTAFTRNWVWNRLTDGKGDRSPRSLLQLFRRARDWEAQEAIRSPYDRSLIRPRALTESLPAVSVEALGALQEEFVELDALVRKLREIGRSPLNADELAEFKEIEPFALEVGLLEVYEGTESEALRFRVPDIYRLALGMTRKGQA